MSGSQQSVGIEQRLCYATEKRIWIVFRRLQTLMKWLILVVLIASIGIVAAQEEEAGQTYVVEEVIAANFPVGMAFAPDGRLFFNEKVTGNVRVLLPDGTLFPAPIVTLPTDALQERGMLGIALSPDFEDDHFVYVVHTLVGNQRDYPANRLVRFTVDEENIAGEIEELLRVPIETGALLHNGGNVHFDAEGYLYLSFGDYGNAAFAQDLDSPQGALHRFEVTDQGLIPVTDNPFGAENSIYAYGLRNPFDFTFDPFSPAIFVSEVGENCDDEINLIQPGMNYGWSEDYTCIGTDDLPELEDYVQPLLSYSPTITPTGIVVYDGEAFPEWQGNLIFCDWNFGKMHRVVLNESRTGIEAVYEVDLGAATCRIDLVIGPEGGLYWGTVGGGGAFIMRMVAVE